MLLDLEAVSDEIEGVRFRRPEATLVRQDHHAQFVLYAIQNDLASAFECANRNKIDTD